MKKYALLLILIGVSLAFGQLPNFPVEPKPNDSLQSLLYKVAMSTNSGMMIPAHDAEVFTYSGSNVVEILYKRGGVNGVTVGLMTLIYSGSNVISQAVTVL